MSVSSKEFLDIQATTECRFTLKSVCDMTRRYSLLFILAIFLSTFTCIQLQVNFLVNRHLFCGHRMSYIANHLEQTDNKTFSGLVGPRHMTSRRQLPIKAEWQDASFGFYNYCYCLVVSGKWRLVIWYRKINVTSFIFLVSKNV